jgi:flagellar hook assembly protein FlgD
MAASGVAIHPRPHMIDPYRTGDLPPRGASTTRSQAAVRVVVLVLSLLLIFVSASALGLVSSARAQVQTPPPKRAVIVAGPVHSLTDRYRDYAEAMARAAEAKGMEVTRVFHPNATKERVVAHANGADLFIYVGHGNGWPSPYGTFQESSKNGLGLNPDDPKERTTSNVLYKGADWIRENILLAPNAVVILSHLSYASGNASSGMAIPTRDVAVQRIDNYANGFLSAGAKVVWALGWQPGADVIEALFSEDATMDAVFLTRYRRGVGPEVGWIGAEAGYYDSGRIPGARIHIDPDPARGYLRGLTGDLAFTTTAWRTSGAAVPPDTVAPSISEVAVVQATSTLATEGPPVFTPNGDGVGDTIKISHLLSEDAFLHIRVRRGDKLVQGTTIWAMAGPGASTWDGRKTDGEYAGEGPFSIEITPMDRAGNTGTPAGAAVTVLSSVRVPRVRPALFNPDDGDALAATAEMSARLLRPAAVSWVVRDATGAVVRHGPARAPEQPGFARFTWDGRDDAGAMLPDGRYLGRIRVSRPAGTVGHQVPVLKMPFRLMPSAWRVKRGSSVRLAFESAEPLRGKPVIMARQPGRDPVRLKVIKVDRDGFRTRYAVRTGGPKGKLRIEVTAVDTAGGSQSQTYTLRLR